LKKRGQDAPAVIARRLAAARSEIEHAPEFDFIVINEDFDLALSQLVAIVTATRLRYSTQMPAIGRYLGN
jgi:guanylate kinase